jgi:hypothetical protein
VLSETWVVDRKWWRTSFALDRVPVVERNMDRTF